MERTSLITPPELVRTEAIRMAHIELNIPRTAMQQMLPPALEELFTALETQGIAPMGPWFAHHTQLPADRFHFNACVPIDADFTASGRVQPGQMPAIDAARTLYRGPYTQLPNAWGEFRAWALARRLATAAEVIERYTVNPHDTPNPDDLETELVWPLVPPQKMASPSTTASQATAAPLTTTATPPKTDSPPTTASPPRTASPPTTR